MAPVRRGDRRNRCDQGWPRKRQVVRGDVGGTPQPIPPPRLLGRPMRPSVGLAQSRRLRYDQADPHRGSTASACPVRSATRWAGGTEKEIPKVVPCRGDGYRPSFRFHRNGTTWLRLFLAMGANRLCSPVGSRAIWSARRSTRPTPCRPTSAGEYAPAPVRSINLS